MYAYLGSFQKAPSYHYNFVYTVYWLLKMSGYREKPKQYYYNKVSISDNKQVIS